MLVDPQPSFRDRLQRYLGTDQIASLHRRIDALEATMANEILTLLNGLVNQTTEASAAQQASFLNLHNGLNRQEQAIRDLTEKLNAALDGNGKVTPEMQEIAARLSESLADIKKAAETADDGFEPVEDPEDEPVDDEDALPEVPVDDTPTTEVPQPETPVVDDGASTKR